MKPARILITGANGGLGLAIARYFLNSAPHHHLLLGVRHRRDQAGLLQQEFPERVELVSLEVSDPSSWKAAMEAHGTAPCIDVLVNNAGSHNDGLLANLSGTQWHEVLDSNLTGAFHGCQAVLPGMIGQRWGRIINISSLSALLAPAGQANYAAAKAGMIAMSQSLAKEVARIGITVNCVCPGYIETEALSSMAPETKAQAVGRIPMRRFGRADEVAAAVGFLASMEAAYITGSVLKVDGGIF